MKIYRYWAKASEPFRDRGQKWALQCYGGSNTSAQEALERAKERLQAVVAAIQSGKRPERYLYGERPLREELLEEFRHEGNAVGVITRNGYGCLVLNSPQVMFADIDRKPPTLGSLWKAGVAKLFGQSRPALDEAVLQHIEQVAHNHPNLGVRVYRTRNGFRCLVTTRTFEPGATETINLMQEFGSDPLYVRLCRAQQCFRARLSPKHWRCGVPRPPNRFPWDSPEAEATFRAWEREYHEQADRFATCSFVTAVGARGTHPQAETVTTIHDRIACASEAPLA